MNVNATIFGQMLSFLVFVWFTMKFVWPAIDTKMQERDKKIADGLSAAELGQEKLDTAAQKSLAILAEARENYRKIIDDATRQAVHIIDEAKVQARTEQEAIAISAKHQIELEITQARSDLQTDIANLVVLGAEKILTREIDINKHQDILENVVKKMVES